MQEPPKKSLGEKSSTWREENLGRRESSVFLKPPRRSSDEERTGGAEGGDQTLFKHHGDLSMSLVRRSLAEKSNIKDEEEKEGPRQQEIQGTS